MRKKKNSNKAKHKIVTNNDLANYNTDQYVDDDLIIERLNAPENKKAWIKNKRIELQNSANDYEKKLFDFLKENNFFCYHQMPFYINQNIYFADFYLPKFRCIIEVDGISHLGQEDRDGDRDEDFKDAGIKTIRILNEEIAPEKLKFRFEAEKLFRERIHNTPEFAKIHIVSPTSAHTSPKTTAPTFTSCTKTLKGKKLVASNIILSIIEELSSMEDGSKILISTDNYTVFDLCYSKMQKDNDWPSVRLFKELVTEKKLIVCMDYRGEAINNKRCMELLSRRMAKARSFTYEHIIKI